MLAISPQLCSYGWVVDDPHATYFSTDRPETSDSIHHLHSPPHLAGDGVKKLNHNASERDRRKKMNTLYSSLRSLLPPEDHSKKLSIPVTVSRVLKYIPELQKEVETLIQKKERLMSKNISVPQNCIINHKTKSTQNSYSAVSATRISDAEVVIQISMPKAEKGSFSEAICRLEEEGFVMLNASCFHSFQGRLFYNLHLQAQDGQVIDADKLKEKAWPFI